MRASEITAKLAERAPRVLEHTNARETSEDLTLSDIAEAIGSALKELEPDAGADPRGHRERRIHRDCSGRAAS